jgi:hypothetical protein
MLVYLVAREGPRQCQIDVDPRAWLTDVLAHRRASGPPDRRTPALCRVPDYAGPLSGYRGL